MMLLCKCGAFKSAPPYKASGTKPWLCDECRSKARRGPGPVITSRPKPAGEGTLLERMRSRVVPTAYPQRSTGTRNGRN